VDTTAVAVAFVGGVGRSGSTLLCRMLHRVPSCIHVGEVCYLWRRGILENLPCSCGEPFLDCPFWTEVGQVGFGGWDQVDAARAERQRRSFSARGELFRAATGRASGRPEDLAAYTELNRTLFRAVRDVSGCSVIVDNSKVASEAYLRLQTDGLETKVVHLVRDSRGVTHSRSKEVPREDIENRQMARVPPGKSVARWLIFNALLTAICRRSGDRMLLRYEDFVADPDTQFRRVVRFLGIAVEPAGLSFLHDDEVELVGDHGIWGNPMRLRMGTQRIRLDEEWRSKMSTTTKAEVTAASLPGLLRYGYLGRRSPAAQKSRST